MTSSVLGEDDDDADAPVRTGTSQPSAKRRKKMKQDQASTAWVTSHMQLPLHVQVAKVVLDALRPYLYELSKDIMADPEACREVIGEIDDVSSAWLSFEKNLWPGGGVQEHLGSCGYCIHVQQRARERQASSPASSQRSPRATECGEGVVSGGRVGKVYELRRAKVVYGCSEGLR